MTLGEKISALRKQRGLSQEDLATMITITRQAISRWEQNESIPDIENIVQLSSIFGVSIDYLLKEGEFTAVRASDGDADAMPIGLPGKRKKSRSWIYRRMFNSGFVYIVGAGVFLLAGFLFDWWHPGWMIFVTLGITHGAMAAWFETARDDD
ncbi:MAG: helix-turn-helix domain-containing protein [Defluviitaleaceae bacterium]|nr:helix-turn-helix domain-containing protein [Defluviitaleaceae bacterium]